ncbi:MAG: hypothetical protein ABFS12_15015 [Bacteroidota bacterium]
MIAGNYNLHQILFSLEMFDDKVDKLGYLYKTKKELQRVIRCFESNKSLPLKMYADDYTQAEGNCLELKDFIRNHYKQLNKNPWDNRQSVESKLRTLVTNEVIEYKKIMLVIDGEIKLIENSTDVKKAVNHEPRNISINIDEINYSYIASLLKENDSKIIWEYSIGELIEIAIAISNKKLIDGLNEGKIPKFIVDNFVDDSQSDFLLEKVKKVYSMFMMTNLALKNN